MSLLNGIENLFGSFTPITKESAVENFNAYKKNNPSASDVEAVRSIYDGISEEKAQWLVEMFDYNKNSLSEDEFKLMHDHISCADWSTNHSSVEKIDIENVEKYQSLNALRALEDRY